MYGVKKMSKLKNFAGSVKEKGMENRRGGDSHGEIGKTVMLLEHRLGKL